MTKKYYLKPELKLVRIQHQHKILAGSVQTNGLGDKNLTQDNTPGDAWQDAMSRHRSVWDDDEEEEQ